jgi:hypothetical protein
MPVGIAEVIDAVDFALRLGLKSKPEMKTIATLRSRLAGTPSGPAL